MTEDKRPFGFPDDDEDEDEPPPKALHDLAKCVFEDNYLPDLLDAVADFAVQTGVEKARVIPMQDRARRARRLAAKHGYRLMKSYARRPTDPTYDRWQILDIRAGVVAGRDDANPGYSLSFEEAEKWLLEATRPT